jgi:hypothetical protein
MKDKKPFKDTKLGKFLTVKAPKVLDIVGNVLPDKGILGIVKNLIDRDPDMPAEDKLEFERLYIEHEREMHALDVQDRANARGRETEFVKATGHIDYMMYFLAVIGMGVFGFIVWHLVREGIPDANREIIIHALGIIEGAVMGMYQYYWGSSAGSRVKDMRK